jgi:hypothetical protein
MLPSQWSGLRAIKAETGSVIRPAMAITKPDELQIRCLEMILNQELGRTVSVSG